ncbi:MAG: hypothetical protein ACPGQL_01415 [Thermoplasmatota archaeon]
MRIPVSVLLAGALMALLGGCLDDEPTTDDEPMFREPVAPMEAPGPFNGTFPFNLDVGVGTPAVAVHPTAGTDVSTETFSVKANATSLIATADWSCLSSPVCELALVLFHNGDVVSIHEAAAEARIELDAPAAGGWRVSMFPSMNGSAVVMATGEMTVQVDYGTTET